MDWTTLQSPQPKPTPAPYARCGWPSLGHQHLSRVDSLPTLDPAQLLLGRRSCRHFDVAPSLTSIGHLLYLSAFGLAQQSSPYGFHLQKSCAPSAGAIHGVHILAIPSKDESIHLYDTVGHSLVELKDSNECAVLARAQASTLVEIGNATLFLFAAEPGMYAAKYDDFESLIWRDAGVLQGYLSFVASALNLDFCLFGVTGDEALRRLDKQGKLFGVGMAAVGGRPTGF